MHKFQDLMGKRFRRIRSKQYKEAVVLQRLLRDYRGGYANAFHKNQVPFKTRAL